MNTKDYKSMIDTNEKFRKYCETFLTHEATGWSNKKDKIKYLDHFLDGGLVWIQWVVHWPMGGEEKGYVKVSVKEFFKQ